MQIKMSLLNNMLKLALASETQNQYSEMYIK